MAGNRTATAILEARGAFQKNPDRKRVEPKSDLLFPADAPGSFNPLQVKWWHRIVKAVPRGVLTGSDEIAVRVVAVLAAEFAANPADMATARIAEMGKWMGKLGLSPVDRARLATKPEGDDDEF